MTGAAGRNLESAGASVELGPMLPKSRIVSVLLLGLGVALIAAGIAAPAFLNFSARMPLDLQKTTWTLRDDDAHSQVLSADGVEPYQGALTYQLNMELQAPSGEDAVTVRVGESTMRGEGQGLGDLDSAKVWTYTMDRLTGAGTGTMRLSDTLASPAIEIPLDGYWLKFPANAEQTNYPVFDPTLRKSVDAVFQEETVIDGRSVYRYHQEIEPVNVATLYAANGNTTTLQNEDGSTEQGYLHHSGWRDIYVDQATGMVVGLDVSIDDYFADRHGEERQQAFVFNAKTSEEDQAAFLQQAESFPRPVWADRVRWTGIGVGSVLVVIGIAGALGLFGRSKASSGNK